MNTVTCTNKHVSPVSVLAETFITRLQFHLHIKDWNFQLSARTNSITSYFITDMNYSLDILILTMATCHSML